jgi:hypothetical protein
MIQAAELQEEDRVLSKAETAMLFGCSERNVSPGYLKRASFPLSNSPLAGSEFCKATLGNICALGVNGAPLPPCPTLAATFAIW